MKYYLVFLFFLTTSCTHLNQYKKSFLKNKQSSSLSNEKPTLFNPSLKYGRKPADDLKHLDSQKIQDNINKHLNSLYSVCHSKKLSQSKKWTQIISSLDNLNWYLSKTLEQEQKLKSEDWKLLLDISNNVKPKVLDYKQIKSKFLKCRSLRKNFFVNYKVYYNLKEEATVDDFPDGWAQKILKSINCACQK